VKSSWTIIVDSREKIPLPIPKHLVILKDTTSFWSRTMQTVKINVQTQALKTGDYILVGQENNICIERKGRLREVVTNCMTKDRKRFVAELERLNEEFHRPILFLEGSPYDFNRELKKKPELQGGLDALMRLLNQYNIELLVLPATTAHHRRAAGEWVARTLINGAL